MVRVCCDESACKYECNSECTKDMIWLNEDRQCCAYENVFGLDDDEDEEEF